MLYCSWGAVGARVVVYEWRVCGWSVRSVGVGGVGGVGDIVGLMTLGGAAFKALADDFSLESVLVFVSVFELASTLLSLSMTVGVDLGMFRMLGLVLTLRIPRIRVRWT